MSSFVTKTNVEKNPDNENMWILIPGHFQHPDATIGLALNTLEKQDGSIPLQFCIIRLFIAKIRFLLYMDARVDL